MIPYLTVTERVSAVMIFKSSGTMQVPAYQSKERPNNQSYLKNGSKKTRLRSSKMTTSSMDQQYHIFDWSAQPDPKKLLKFQ